MIRGYTYAKETAKISYIKDSANNYWHRRSLLDIAFSDCVFDNSYPYATTNLYFQPKLSSKSKADALGCTSTAKKASSL